jgi:hypothetical protein
VDRLGWDGLTTAEQTWPIAGAVAGLAAALVARALAASRRRRRRPPSARTRRLRRPLPMLDALSLLLAFVLAIATALVLQANNPYQRQSCRICGRRLERRMDRLHDTPICWRCW